MKIFKFGENVDKYDVAVLNEREVRASAGILFLFAIISFLNSWLIGDFEPTKIFVMAFLLDFFIRIFINPTYSPSLIIGRFMVRNQKVEYTAAKQKRFAWGIGFVLAGIMFYLLVLKGMIGPFNLLICLACLLLLFFESVFGICLACIVYNIFHQEKAKLCPGNSCEIKQREPIQAIKVVHYAIVFLFVLSIYGIAHSPLVQAQNLTQKSTQPSIIKDNKKTTSQTNSATATPSKKSIPAQQQDVNKTPTKDECINIPAWVKKIGHEEKWKLHNGCN